LSESPIFSALTPVASIFSTAISVPDRCPPISH
jgi:hypothetical protein